MGNAMFTLALFGWDAGAARNDEVVAVMLICLVVSIAVSAIVIHRIIRSEASRRTFPPPRSPGSFVPSAAALVEAPVRWLAIRTVHPSVVQAALRVRHARACAWSDALITPFEPRLFISPSVRGWVIVTGCDLPDPGDDVDKCFLFLTALSQKLGEVQFFVRNRPVSHHGWVRLDGGKVVRGYVWAGETLWAQGAMTDAEHQLKLRCLSYLETPDALGLTQRELLSANADKVLRLAGEWSIDPTTVEAEALEAKGIAGDLLHSKLH